MGIEFNYYIEEFKLIKDIKRLYFREYRDYLYRVLYCRDYL